MTTQTFRIADEHDFEEVCMTCDLAMLVTEIFFGVERTTLELSCKSNGKTRRFQFGTGNDVGRFAALCFYGLARREFGDSAIWLDDPESA